MKPGLSPLRVVDSAMCIGCGACAGEPGRAVEFDAHGHLKPRGEWTSEPSDAFARVCPFSPEARNEDEIAGELYPDAPHHGMVGRFLASYVGYADADGFRDRGSSGGMVSWTLAELLRVGLVDAVAHVAPDDQGRLFGYRISRTIEEVNRGAKSRYYPVEMSEVLRTIRATPGRYAIVGVPCFIKALNLLRREDPVLRERISFTLGLFCGHMKSARMIESFAWQMETDIANVRRAEHRIKDPSRPASTYTTEVELKDGEVRRKDWWNLADGDWGAGFFMNPACDWCDDVIAETADISFGDAWVEPYSSDGNGTNVVVVRSTPVAELVTAAIAEGRLHLEPVNAEFVQQTQAAGFRHRREGLAYRLTWRKRGIRPIKRVNPSRELPRDRKLVYRMRRFVSGGSNRVFLLARRLGRPAVYVRWARTALALYHGVAYGRGRVGAALRRLRLIE